MRQINYIIIHCSATKAERDFHVRYIDKEEVLVERFTLILYNFMTILFSNVKLVYS